MKTDIEIANSIELRHISLVAKKLKLKDDKIEYYGKYKAKISPLDKSLKAKLILVTAINPTPMGEGKTTVSIGLADGLSLLEKRVCLALREPSLGPVFGIKGGAAGGGYSQVVPMTDINLHFTGDLHAITSANNLLSAMLDNHIHQGNSLEIDLKNIVWHRCIDLNDRALRNIIVGMGKATDGIIRTDSFDITAASEVMAILCLSSDIDNLKQRLGNILIAYNKQGQPVYAKDIKANEAMAILLKDALKPNLVQTLEGTPAILHGGPFANIAHGCNSIIATKTAMMLSDYVVTEAGFGADLGAEKFLDVKCRVAGLQPDAVVLVATIRALKYNGGILKGDLALENLKALKQGMENLKKHIENLRDVFNQNVIVAINKFNTDTDAEIKLLKKECKNINVQVITSTAFADGGKGAIDLAKAVIEAVKIKKKLKFTYKLEDKIENKIKAVATKIYGAIDISLTDVAKKQIAKIEKLGYSSLPIIIAKTQYSLSDKAELLNRPKDFNVTVREVVLRSGAGFIVAICGDIMLMPGLPKTPAAEIMTIDSTGKIDGLF